MKNAVLVLGRMFPKDAEADIVAHSRGMVSSAASAHIEKIIQGLDYSFGDEVRVLNVPPVSSYPKWYDKPFVEECVYSHNGNTEKNDISIGYFNLMAVKNIFIQQKVNRYALEWARTTDAQNKYVVVYTMNEIFLNACRKIKKVCPGCHICVIVPDLPAYTDLDKSGILYKMIIDRRIRKTNALSSVADSFVFLTEQMADYFPVKRPYIVSEAIAPDTAVPEYKEKSTRTVTVAYTGSFTKKYGIMELLNAIDNIRSDHIRFVICGSGEAYDEIAEKARHDSRIDFRGMVTHNEALEIQKNADILVNPRMNDGEYTKYSFPSKIMEYMATGKPVMCFKLDGIPDEYDKYLTYFESASAMAQQIEMMCTLTHEQLAAAGRAGAEFVLHEKSCRKFGEKIRALMEKKRLLICSDDLAIGGTTTSLLSLLNMLDNDKYAVDLVMPDNNGELMDRIPPYVNILPPAAEQSRMKRRVSYFIRGYAFKRYIYARTMADKYPNGLFQLMSGVAAVSISKKNTRYYDAAIGYMEGFADNYIIKKTSAVKKLLYVHVNYADSKLDPSFDTKLFEKADSIAVVSEASRNALQKIFPAIADKICVVENPISSEFIRSMADEPIPETDYAPKDCFNIVTAARLVNRDKALDRAIDAMAKTEKAKRIRWYVFGDGTDREMLQALIHKHRLEDSFFLMGSRKNIYPYIKRADLFVLCSRNEGKPVCVTEAQILGCAPLVTEYASAHEQIQHGIDGIICENSDADALCEAIRNAVDDPRGLYEIRRYLSKNDYSCKLDGFYKFLSI